VIRGVQISLEYKFFLNGMNQKSANDDIDDEVYVKASNADESAI